MQLVSALRLTVLAAAVTAHEKIGDYRWGWQSLVLDRQIWQGNYAESVVHALACAAGLVATKRSLDVDGVDFHIMHPGRLGARRHPAVDVQVESWNAPQLVGDDFACRLPRINYDNLVGKVGEDFPLSRLLLLVIVPVDHNRYVSVNGDCVSLFHSVYWASIMHYPKLGEDENLSSKTVYVPSRNVVTPEVMRELLCREYVEGVVR